MEGEGDGKRLGGAELVKEGETGDTGEAGGRVEGAMKRNAGTWVGDDGAEGSLTTRRGELLLGSGREKFWEGEREIESVAETVESERTTVALVVRLRLGAAWVDLSAWLQGVVQMLFECPQA